MSGQTAKAVPPADWLTPMSVDGHSGDFEKLANDRLPSLFTQLAGQIQKPISLSLFTPENFGPAGLIKLPEITTHLADLENALDVAQRHSASIKRPGCVNATGSDFAGIYVLIASSRPFYVGISRTVLKRLQTHVRQLEHHTASLLFNLVRDYEVHVGERKALNLSSSKAKEIQHWLQNQAVAILPLACPVERYALELYAAMKLKTGKWNSFETH